MKRLLPQTLAGQMIALLLLALIGSQLLSFWFFFDERRAAVRAAARGQVFSRTSSIVRLLNETPPRLHTQILDAASNPRLRFWLSQEPIADEIGSDDGRGALLTDHLQHELPPGTEKAFVNVNEDGESFSRPWRRRQPHEHRAREYRPDRPWPRAGQRLREDSENPRLHGHRVGLKVSVLIADQLWLNAETALRVPPLTWALPSFVAIGVTAVALIIIVVVMVRRITRPMHRLATAADRLGRGESVKPLREEGPRDIRQTTRAFDRMRERLQRFVQDRTMMLAAISHDLRTPLTTLRLRAEFIDDPDAKEKMLATIDEMNAMVEATLAFAREESAQEDTHLIDLAALVESVCADLSDIGQDTRFEPHATVSYACRPIGLKRVVRNLIENAVRYGTRALVHMEVRDTAYLIFVDDDGPGIPEGKLDLVFEPFMRIDESRNEESGGIGLGLSIVRSIVQSHGGEVALANRAEGGLRATITLPRD